MNGWPVWLASVSRRDIVTSQPITTDRWSAPMFGEGEAILDRLLGPVGDKTRERSFRMHLTLCRHRAATEKEVAALPQWWHDAPAVDLAGGGLEVLWTKGLGEDVPLVQPCVDPGKHSLSVDVALRVDCGVCEPCMARASWEADHPSASGGARVGDTATV